MKLCFSTLACPNWTLPQIIGAAAAHGLEGIDFRGVGAEIDVTKLTIFNAELPSTLELLNAHKIEAPCLNSSIVLVTPAQERWQMMLDECQRYATLATKLGSKYLRIFGGEAPKGMSRDEARMLAQRHLRQVQKIASASGCEVLLETHDDWSTSEQVLQLVGDFSPDEAAILWDLEHPHMHGETAEKTIAALGPYLKHIHIKDGVRSGEHSLPRLLGEGELPLKPMLKALKSSGYDAWICLETEKRWHPTAAPEPEESLPQFARYMRENWK